MNELFPLLLVLVVGTAAAYFVVARFPRQDGQLLLGSFAAHIAAAFIQLWFTLRVYGVGDMIAYMLRGEQLAAAIRMDPVQFGPEVVKLLFHQPALIPVEVRGPGTSTGSLEALSGLLAFLTGGSIYTLSCIIAIGAYFGQVALYAAFRDALPRPFHRAMLWAALLIPSEIYWCSGLIKEGAATAGVGVAIFGFGRLLKRVQLQGIVALAIGATIVFLFKPYILFTLGVSGAAWFYLYRAPESRVATLGPSRLVLGIVGIAIAAAVLLKLFPEYAPENLAERAAYYQETGQEVAGGSTYTIGGGTEHTFVGQMAYAPLALVTSIFRPFIFEARNPQVFVNAIETTFLLVLAIRVLWATRAKQFWAMMTRFPILAFCAVFTVLFGVGVGLTTTNLGALSRYRMPLIPFVWGLLLALHIANKAAARAAPRASLPARNPRRAPPAQRAALQRSGAAPSRSP